MGNIFAAYSTKHQTIVMFLVMICALMVLIAQNTTETYEN